jgi:hypothetical protein
MIVDGEGDDEAADGCGRSDRDRRRQKAEGRRRSGRDVYFFQLRRERKLSHQN